MNVRFQRPVLAVALLGLLAACGGGDDEGGGGLPPITTPQSPVGVFYSTPPRPGDSSGAMLGMVLPPATLGGSHVYFFAKQVAGLSTDYDALFGTMSLIGPTMMSYDGRYYLSQENRQVGGIKVRGTVVTNKTLMGRYDNPHAVHQTLPISMDYQASTYERNSSLNTIKGVYQSAGSYFGNSWSLQVDASGGLKGSLSGGCSVNGEIGLMDTSRGVYQVKHLDLSGDNCDRKGKEFNGVATVTFDAAGNKSGIWLLTAPKDIGSSVKPVVLVGALDPTIDPEAPLVSGEGLWVGNNQQSSGYNGVVLPNNQYFFYSANGTVLYGMFSNSTNALKSDNGVYLASGVVEQGVRVTATSVGTGQMKVSFTAGGGAKTLDFSTELAGVAGSPPLYGQNRSLSNLIGNYRPPAGFGSTGMPVTLSAVAGSTQQLELRGVKSATCELVGSVRPFGAQQHNLFELDMIYEGTQCGAALETQQGQGGVVVATLDAAGNVNGIRLLALGQSTVTNERLYTVYHGSRQ